ncbi:hypothetical protein HNQ91_000763 [Filimonas zeae]|uniref:Starch-binding protein n=1 Tax=Filimonas zeae TaxID=1737353 RepID=A0A917MTV0_9BACT|nr:RagB/SusD family nutrient uptake outer membrane protein [Filimonas zeae]MDR6337741.1 hypothetical protein [Filimonas zeae]GGH60049.1 starch-binding protein [Filimonas zeae]
MKISLRIALYVAIIMIAGGCNKFLDTKSNSQPTLDNYFTTLKDCRSATAAMYSRVWYSFSSKFYFDMGDGRGNNLFQPYTSGQSFIRLTETGETTTLQEGWASLYVVITQADYILNNIDRALQFNVSERDVNACKAEARFMRGLAYWYAGSTWGNIPIVEDPVALSKNAKVPPHYFEDVLQYAISDLEYAAKNLRTTDEKGRVTRYSALGILSRLYITAACYARGNRFSERWTKNATEYYELARIAAKEVCENSAYTLMSDYEELFRPQNNNNTETLFALQFVPGSTDYGAGNRNQEWLAYSTTLTDGLNAYGSSTFASGELVKLMHDRGELKRKKAAFFYPGAVYDYIGTHTADGKWIVTGANAVRYPNIKKHVVGSKKDTDGMAINGNSGLAAPMLRLAEVYLLYAEAILGTQASTTDAEALKYFNLVRKRAGLDPVTAISVADLWDERRCELALEGQFWFDMVRRGYWDQAWVLDYMNHQRRSEYYYYLSNTAPNGFAWRNVGDGQEQNTATEARLLLPYPSTELVMNPKLNEAPVHFTF